MSASIEKQWFDLQLAFKLVLTVICVVAAACLSGCRTSVDGYGRLLRYGMSESDVHKIITYDSQSVFIFRDLDGRLYKCSNFSFDGNCVNYYFLYEDGVLISIIQEDDFKNKLEQTYADSKKSGSLPFQNSYSNLKQFFVPPMPVGKIDFNQVNNKRKEMISHGRLDCTIEMVMLSPFIIGLSPIYLPFMINDICVDNRARRRIADAHKIGLSSEEVKIILGTPRYAMGDTKDYLIMSFDGYKETPDSHMCHCNIESYGFRNDRVEWILFDTLIYPPE